MRCYLTTFNDHIDLVPYFVRHWGKFAHEFHVQTFGKEETHDKVIGTVEELGFRAFSVKRWEAKDYNEHRRHETIAAYHGDKGWHLQPDLDEFASITPEQMDAAIAQNPPYLVGWWYERCGPNGLVDLDTSLTLDEQFTMTGRIPWLLGVTVQNPVWFAAKIPYRTHHPNAREAKKYWFPNARFHYEVHHFKWTESMLTRMKERKKTHEDQGYIHRGTALDVLIQRYEEHGIRTEFLKPADLIGI